MIIIWKKYHRIRREEYPQGWRILSTKSRAIPMQWKPGWGPRSQKLVKSKLFGSCRLCLVQLYMSQSPTLFVQIIGSGEESDTFWGAVAYNSAAKWSKIYRTIHLPFQLHQGISVAYVRGCRSSFLFRGHQNAGAEWEELCQPEAGEIAVIA